LGRRWQDGIEKIKEGSLGIKILAAEPTTIREPIRQPLA
jgi:hypothetical protein